MSGAKSMRTPLGRVRNLGAAAEGTGHFIGLRITSVALTALSVWFVVAAAYTMDAPSYQAAINFLHSPLNALGVILLVVVSIYHMQLGMQEVIVDYIHKPSTKVILLLLNGFAPFVLGAGAVFAVLRINFWG
jgi:succinate dehydrogenase / fumarate reductase membrane anchor subunit